MFIIEHCSPPVSGGNLCQQSVLALARALNPPLVTVHYLPEKNIMLKNYLTIAFRNLQRNKGFSLINILGLAVGMASAILILLWIQNEMSHDRFHQKGSRLYTVNNRDKFNGEYWAWSSTPKILGPTLKLEYPQDVEDVVRINFSHFLLTVGDKHLNVDGNFTDSGFLSMFSFPVLYGNANNALSGVDNIVITQSLAKEAVQYRRCRWQSDPDRHRRSVYRICRAAGFAKQYRFSF